MRRRNLSTAVAAAVIALVSVTGISAASFTLDDLIQVSGSSPFTADCDNADGQTGEAV